MTIRSVIRSTGAYLPERVMTNQDLEKIVDTSDEWITQRSGIRERRIAAEGETTADMAIAAGKAALEHGGLSAADIDGVIVCTSTPNHTFPAVAVDVQAALGIAPCPAFDLQAVCSGFVYGLNVANMFVQSGQCKRLLLIGAEKFSSILDWTDRTTCVLFGDGAGAVVLEADETGQGTLDDRGILFSRLYADGRQKGILYTSGGPATTQDSGYVVMEGKEVFRHAVSNMASIVSEVLEENDLSPDRIDWLIPHQANIRIIEGTAKKLGMGMDKVVVTVDRHGNTSAASIPLALNEAVRDGRIRKGQMVLFEALGAGLTWGAVLARF
ncbi:MAG: ketoacyl-ACP synthase III [Rhodospirillales bacterium]|nr:ketoacyl-ACP synthase III [Rhodospirillales bacterium]MCB9995517.1 ketoacyl-ACP synthase III [Rhodospirillales bacterium]